MEYKYVLLKTSWGIVVLIEMEELRDPEIGNADVKICNDIYLRIEDTKSILRGIIIYWAEKAIKDSEIQIRSVIADTRICYSIKRLDFNHCDFQEEGLYCVVQGWLSEYYKIKPLPIEVYFDETRNRYVFPKLSNL
jgi:hypothetical protein